VFHHLCSADDLISNEMGGFGSMYTARGGGHWESVTGFKQGNDDRGERQEGRVGEEGPLMIFGDRC
jgi:hypothetical protein